MLDPQTQLLLDQFDRLVPETPTVVSRLRERMHQIPARRESESAHLKPRSRPPLDEILLELSDNEVAITAQFALSLGQTLHGQCRLPAGFWAPAGTVIGLRPNGLPGLVEVCGWLCDHRRAAVAHPDGASFLCDISTSRDASQFRLGSAGTIDSRWVTEDQAVALSGKSARTLRMWRSEDPQLARGVGIFRQYDSTRLRAIVARKTAKQLGSRFAAEAINAVQPVLTGA